MAEARNAPVRLDPDPAFVRRIRRIGGEGLKYCYQCGTCTAVCPVTPDGHPFPRKEMLWAQWGLRDRLLNDPDLWLCHGCGDCTARCPRGAKPSEVLAALRADVIAHHAVPAFLGRWAASPAFLPLLLALPVLVMVIGFFLAGGFHVPEGEVHYFKLVPFLAVEVIGNGFVLLALVGAGLGLSRFRRGMDAQRAALGALHGPGAAPPPPAESPLRSVLAVVREILAHRRFRLCGEAKARARHHAALLYGFLLLFAASGGRLFNYYVLGSHDELPLSDPIKIVGNAGGLAMALGLIGVTGGRLARRAGVSTSSYSDWSLIGALALAVFTGFAAQGARLGHGGALAYYAYLVHLVFVFALLVYLPYSKFAHLLYRFTALLHARRTGRDPAADLPSTARPAAGTAADPSPGRPAEPL